MAWNFLFDKEINSITIREAHGILMAGLNPDIAEKFRDCKVYIGGNEAPDFRSVPALIALWCGMVGNPQESHVAFEKIHPFVDGNGRIGRIIYNIQRMRLGKDIHVIHEGEEQFEYYQWFL